MKIDIDDYIKHLIFKRKIVRNLIKNSGSDKESIMYFKGMNDLLDVLKWELEVMIDDA